MNQNSQINRGMVWLGSATLVSRIIDVLSLLFVLRFLTQEELGVATLAWSFAAFFEGLNGLGISSSVVQKPDLDEVETASAQWYASAVGVALALFVAGLAPFIASYYDVPVLEPMLQVAALKFVFVGLANVPLALASRGLRFRELGAIATAATLCSAVITLSLAAFGAGPWAPLLGNTAHGAFQLLGVVLLAPQPLRRSYSHERLKPLLQKGLAVAGAGVVGQFARNLDYLILGRLAGPAVLGIYRIAFDLAMAPTLAILQVVNRSAMPVYSRIAQQPSELRQAFAWTQRNILLLTMLPLIVIYCEAGALFQLFGKVAAADAVLATRILCAVALVRALSQAYPPLFVATGNPRFALYDSLASAALLASLIASALAVFAGASALIVTALAWAAACLLLLPLDMLLSQRALPGSTLAGVSVLRRPLFLTLLLVGAAELLSEFSPLVQPGLRLGLHGAVLVGLFLLGVRFVVNLGGLGAFREQLRAKSATSP